MLSGSHTVRSFTGLEGRQAAVVSLQRQTLLSEGSASFDAYPPAGCFPYSAAGQPGSDCGDSESLQYDLSHRNHNLLWLAALPLLQLGSKGYGDPVTFDNTYYKTLLDKPWERVSADMAAHIGGWRVDGFVHGLAGGVGGGAGGGLRCGYSLAATEPLHTFVCSLTCNLCLPSTPVPLPMLLLLQASPPTMCCPTTPPAAPSSRSMPPTSSSSSATLRPPLPR